MTLMIADVPARQVARIERLMMEDYPEMRFAGEAPGAPIFP
ncbi:hypothetical protein ACFQUU_15440 [Herbaspirillum sp. GCM10030257]